MLTLRRPQSRYHGLSPDHKSKFSESSSPPNPPSPPVLQVPQVLELLAVPKGTSTRPASEERGTEKTKEKRVCDNRKDINSPRCFRVIFCFEVFFVRRPSFCDFLEKQSANIAAGYASESERCEKNPDHVLPRQSPARDLAVCLLVMIGGWKGKRRAKTEEERREDEEREGKKQRK